MPVEGELRIKWANWTLSFYSSLGANEDRGGVRECRSLINFNYQDRVVNKLMKTIAIVRNQ